MTWMNGESFVWAGGWLIILLGFVAQLSTSHAMPVLQYVQLGRRDQGTLTRQNWTFCRLHLCLTELKND